MRTNLIKSFIHDIIRLSQFHKHIKNCQSALITQKFRVCTSSLLMLIENWRIQLTRQNHPWDESKKRRTWGGNKIQEGEVRKALKLILIEFNTFFFLSAQPRLSKTCRPDAQNFRKASERWVLKILQPVFEQWIKNQFQGLRIEHWTWTPLGARPGSRSRWQLLLRKPLLSTLRRFRPRSNPPRSKGFRNSNFLCV